MRTVLLHPIDAIEPEPDPVIAQVSEALTALGHSVEPVIVRDSVEAVIEDLRRVQPELVFNLAENFAGESALESSVAALLTLLGLRFTGSSPAGLLLAGDKALAKTVLGFYGLKSPEFATIDRGAVGWAGDLEFPLIVKPPLEDGSLGVHRKSVVRDVKALLGQVGEIHEKYQQPVLIEQFVEGREFYVGVLGNAHAEALPIVELDFSGLPDGQPRIASWEAKWGESGRGEGEEFAGTRSVLASGLEEDLAKRTQQVAVDAFHALRLRDYARVDMRVTDGGDIYVLEVNPNCYLERESEFARSAASAGIKFDNLIARILELATARYAH
jgi:D-alanine-D-alanine ligase